MATEEEAKEIKNKHSSFILGLPGVIGLGVAEHEPGSYGLVVHVDSEGQNLRETLADRIKGLDVKIEKTDRYRKF